MCSYSFGVSMEREVLEFPMLPYLKTSLGPDNITFGSSYLPSVLGMGEKDVM